MMGSSFVDILGWTLVHFLWEGAIVAGALWIVLRRLSKKAAAVRYGVCGAALFSLALAPVVTLALLWLQRQAEPGGTVVFVDSMAQARRLVAASGGTAIIAAEKSALQKLLPPLVGIWAIGVALLSLRLLGGLYLVERLKHRFCAPAPADWQDRLNALAEKLAIRGRVVLAVSQRVGIPSTIGVFRTFVILPAAIFTKMAPDQIEAILVHELAHVARRDYLVNLLQSILETVLFYHPAVWWVSHVARLEREHCCDDVVVRVAGGPALYAQTLALLEERRQAPSPALMATGGLLMNRIRRILGLSSAPLRPSAVFATAVLLLGFVVLLGFAGQATASDAPPKPNVKDQPTPQRVETPRKVIVVSKPAIASASAEVDAQPPPPIKPAPGTRPKPADAVHYYALPVDTAEEFLGAIESGKLRLPEGVTVTLKEESNVSPRFSLSGERAAVDRAMRTIEASYKYPPVQQVLIKCAIWHGGRIVGSPTLRDLADRPCSLTETVANGGGGGTQVAMRLSPKCRKDGRISLWACLGASGLRVVVPFPLSAKEDLSIVSDPKGNVVLTATDLNTKASRSVPVPPEWEQLDGLRFTIKAELADSAGNSPSRWTHYVPDETVTLTLKGPFADVVQFAARQMGISAACELGAYKELTGGVVRINPTLRGDQQKRQWEQIAQFFFCESGNATYELRNGVYCFKPTAQIIR